MPPPPPLELLEPPSDDEDGAGLDDDGLDELFTTLPLCPLTMGRVDDAAGLARV